MIKRKAVVIGLIIILIGSIWLFFPFKEETYYYDKHISINLNDFRDKFETPTIENMFRKIASPFNFKFLKVNIGFIENKTLNNCSYIDMATVNFPSNGKIIKIHKGEEKFVGYIKSDEYYIDNMTVTYDINSSLQNQYNCDLIVAFSIKASVSMAWEDAIGNMFILFSFYSALFLLFLNFKEKIYKKNLKKKKTINCNMLDDLTRDTFNMLGLSITSLGLVFLASAKLSESFVYIMLFSSSLVGTFMFSILAVKGSFLLIRRGLSQLHIKKEHQKEHQKLREK